MGLKTKTESDQANLNLSLHPRTMRLATFAATAVLGFLANSDPGEAKTFPAPKGGPAGQIGLSDERTLTRWTHANYDAPVRSWPSNHSKTRFRLKPQADDGSAEVFIVRSKWISPSGQEWTRIRIPEGEKSTEGWVEREDLSAFGTSDAKIRINRKLFRLTLYKKGQPVLHTPIGVGSPTTPTPAGRFWVRERDKVNRYKTFNLFGENISNTVLGPYVLMTTAQPDTNSNWPGGGYIGIHGTNRPDLIPGRPSHGCIRLKNNEVDRIAHQTPPGTPIEIV